MVEANEQRPSGLDWRTSPWLHRFLYRLRWGSKSQRFFLDEPAFTLDDREKLYGQAEVGRRQQN